MTDKLHQIDGKYFQKAYTKLLPTDKPVIGCLHRIKNSGYITEVRDNSQTNPNNHFDGEFLHLYILTDEEIKELP